MLAEIFERRVLDGRVLEPGTTVDLPAADVDRLGETGAAQAAVRLITVNATIPILTRSRAQIGEAHATHRIVHEQGMSGTRTVSCTRTVEVNGEQHRVNLSVDLDLDHPGAPHYTINHYHEGIVIGESVATENEVTRRDAAGRMQLTVTRRYDPPRVRVL